MSALHWVLFASAGISGGICLWRKTSVPVGVLVGLLLGPIGVLLAFGVPRLGPTQTR
jgi:hypothetical protein